MSAEMMVRSNADMSSARASRATSGRLAITGCLHAVRERHDDILDGRALVRENVVDERPVRSIINWGFVTVGIAALRRILYP